MIKPKKLGHIVLKVSDMAASRDFYMRTLGLKVSAENLKQGVCFLSIGDEHHDIAVFQRATEPAPSPEQPGLIHIAWQLPDMDELRAAYRELTAGGIAVRALQHNVTNSIYFDDPDGHTIELYVDRWENNFEAMTTNNQPTVPLDIESGEPVAG